MYKLLGQKHTISFSYINTPLAQWDANVFQQPVAGQTQQKQHAMKANQRFIWPGNLPLITALMSRVKGMISEVSPVIFPADRGARLLLLSLCE